MKLIQVRFKGLFGNQALTYSTARAWAERFGAELQTDPWVGETLFENVTPNPIKGGHDLYVNGCWFDREAIDKADVVLVDYFMSLLSKEPVKDGIAGCQIFEFTRSQLRRWFKFKPEYAYESPFEQVFHLRYWDPHVSNMTAIWHSPTVHPCANITLGSYVRAAEANSYDRRGFEIVHEREPHYKAGIPKQLQFCVDFQILEQAEVLFRANSSFSFLAGAIGKGRVFSPLMAGVKGSWNGEAKDVEFTEGNETGSWWPGGLMGSTELSD